MYLEELLATLSAHSGLDFHLDSNGSCAFEYGLGFELTLSSIDAGSGALLHQPILSLSQTEPELQLRKCMELNLYGTQTYGAILGLDAQSGWIVLAHRIAVTSLNAQQLEELLMQFIALAQNIAAQFGEFTQQTANDEALETSKMILR